MTSYSFSNNLLKGEKMKSLPLVNPGDLVVITHGRHEGQTGKLVKRLRRGTTDCVIDVTLDSDQRTLRFPTGWVKLTKRFTKK